MRDDAHVADGDALHSPHLGRRISRCPTVSAPDRTTQGPQAEPLDDGHGQEQIESLYTISVEIAGPHQLDTVVDRALESCLELSGSELGFGGLVDDLRCLGIGATNGYIHAIPRRVGTHNHLEAVMIASRRGWL
jgi:hypothetical protein